MTTLDAIGFGSLNLDEFWEVPRGFLAERGLEPGREYVRDLEWFTRVYPLLAREGVLRAQDPGGSAANTIAALAKMGCATGFFGSTGSEDAAALRLSELGATEDLKITLRDIPAGRCLVLIDPADLDRDRALVVLPNANDLVAVDEVDLGYFERASWVHLTSFVSNGPLEAQVRLVEQLRGPTRISFDPGAVYATKGFGALESILRRSEVLFAAEEELLALSGESSIDRGAARMLEVGARIVVVKLGAQGLRCFAPEGIFDQPPVLPRQVLDRTGAGDVAAAGFLAGMIAGLGVKQSLGLAAAAASRSIEGYGRSAYPDRESFRGWCERAGSEES